MLNSAGLTPRPITRPGLISTPRLSSFLLGIPFSSSRELYPSGAMRSPLFQGHEQKVRVLTPPQQVRAARAHRHLWSQWHMHVRVVHTETE